MSQPIEWGTPLSDEEVTALASTDADFAGGDSEAWAEGVTLLYIFDESTELDGLVFPPGQYLRHVALKKELGWLVTGDAQAYVEAIEEEWVAYDNAPTEPCGDCGAGAHEECQVSNCPGTWR